MKPNDTTSTPRRKSSLLHYQTFGINPPKSRGQPLSDSSGSANGDHNNNYDYDETEDESTPLPLRQIVVVAIISLCEQTALNSMSPYLPSMASNFPEVEPANVGVYVGTIASAYALAQLTSNYFWGWTSDRIGRKPVILTGTFLTAICVICWGFCRTLWQAIVIQASMGLVNGNQGIVSTILGEITDRSNQSKAFAWLPVIYGIGAVTGPLVGGLLVMEQNPFDTSKPNPYPYLLPNIVSASLLFIDFIITSIFMEESLERAQDLPPLPQRFKSLFPWTGQFHGLSRSAHNRSGVNDHQESTTDGRDEEDDHNDSSQRLLWGKAAQLKRSDIFTRDTILLLVCYLVFQLSNVAYTSLYPVWAADRPPTGRSLSPRELGLTLGFAGIVVIIFQVGLFTPIRNKIGNRWSFRSCLALFVFVYLLTPWIGYKNPPNYDSMSIGKVALWIELGVVLMVKTIAAVGGLTSALILVTNSAPNHEVLGALNGLAQTISALGRSIGPFVAGSLYTVATHVKPKGEALAFGVFGCIALIGFILSFGIRNPNLESEDWADDDAASNKSEEEEEEVTGHA